MTSGNHRSFPRLFPRLRCKESPLWVQARSKVLPFCLFSAAREPRSSFLQLLLPRSGYLCPCRGMGTEGTFVEAPALPLGLTGILASAVDPEGTRENFWSRVPLGQTGYMTSIRNPGASWPLCCGLKHLGIRIWTE